MPAVLYIEREDESFSIPLDEVAILNVDDKKLYIKNKNCLNGVTWSDNDKIKKIYGLGCSWAPPASPPVLPGSGI